MTAVPRAPRPGRRLALLAALLLTGGACVQAQPRTETAVILPRVDIVGIATDHCVRATALDAVEAGFTTRVLLNFTAGVAPETTSKALSALRQAGVELVGDLLYDGSSRTG